MPITTKQYLDYQGLSTYDGLLKEYIDSANTLGIKKVAWDTATEQILFFRDSTKSAVEDSDFQVSISSSAVQALNTRVGIDKVLNAYQEKANLTEILNVLTGDNETAGSVANAVAASAKDLNNAITNITKDGGTIDTKISAHNTAADAHQDLFNAKQNKIITKNITLDAADFAADETATTQYAYKCNKTVEGISANKDYIPSVVPMKESEEVISEAVFSAEVDFEAAVLTFYSVNVPTASINLFVTFTEI